MFFRFFVKSLKVKNAYFGGFLVKNEIFIWKEKEKFALLKYPYFFHRGLRIKDRSKSLFLF